MNIVEIIDKKRKKIELSNEEISYAIMGYINGEIKDYQMSSLLMAITINGMTDNEVFTMVDVMIKSGDTIDLSMINKKIVDKHSTGGVGDKTTLIVGPIVAATNLAVAKMSGRGLGHTGGTIDKLESIPGFKVEISNDDFIKQINEIGFALVSQKGNLVPADKKIYALRDVTGTTSSIPLIAASIMSKKIASGADYIVLDVKVGNGAFMEDVDSAKELSTLMKKIGEKYNKKTICILSNMNEPLGKTVGNSLEVLECIEFFEGKRDNNLYELVVQLSTSMVMLGHEISYNEALKLVLEVIDNGLAYKKFKQFIIAQGGQIEKIEVSKRKQAILSLKSGYIKEINCHKLGSLVKDLGGGRVNKEDLIDYTVGFIINKNVGDYVSQNDLLATVYFNLKDIVIKDILSCFVISEEKTEKNKVLIDIV